MIPYMQFEATLRDELSKRNLILVSLLFGNRRGRLVWLVVVSGGPASPFGGAPHRLVVDAGSGEKVNLSSPIVIADRVLHEYHMTNAPERNVVDVDVVLEPPEVLPRRATFYIAAALHYHHVARDLAATLRDRSFLIVSSWHEDPAASPEAEASMTLDVKRAIADTCLREVTEADEMVLLYGHPTTRGGHLIEAGVAIGQGKQIHLVPVDGLESLPLPSILLFARNRDIHLHASHDALVRHLEDTNP